MTTENPEGGAPPEPQKMTLTRVAAVYPPVVEKMLPVMKTPVAVAMMELAAILPVPAKVSHTGLSEESKLAMKELVEVPVAVG